MYYENGDRYEGFMKNGKKEGQGVLYKNDGEEIEGLFKDDILVEN